MMFAPAIATVSPLLNPSLLATIASAVIAVFAGGGYWAYRVAKRKEPLDTRTVEVATADQLGKLALSIAQDARVAAAEAQEEARQARGDASATRAHSHVQDEQIRKLTAGFRTMQRAWEDLIDNWPTIRLNPEPPRMPVVDIGPHNNNPEGDSA